MLNQAISSLGGCLVNPFKYWHNFRQQSFILSRQVPSEIAILSSILILILGASLCTAWGTPPLVDEYGNMRQIEWFIAAKYVLVPTQSMGPGYHAAMAVIAKTIGLSNLDSLRFLNACFSFVCVLIFYAISKMVTNEASLARSIQFALLPVLYPYLTRVYTDTFGLLCILLCYFFQLKKKLLIAGIIGLFSIVTRQTNIVWIGMFYFLGYYTVNEFNLSWDRIKKHVLQYWPYGIILVIFVIFVFLNEGVALGDKDVQHTVIQLNNIYFLLIIFGICFFPLMLAQASKMARSFTEPGTYVVLAISFILYLFAFQKMHYWNTIWDNNSYCLLRNLILLWISKSLLYKMFFFLPIALSVAYMRVADSANRKLYILGGVSLFLLALTYLVEPRYYIPSLSFYILFRDYRWPKYEFIQSAYLFIVSLTLMYVTVAFNCVL